MHMHTCAGTEFPHLLLPLCWTATGETEGAPAKGILQYGMRLEGLEWREGEGEGVRGRLGGGSGDRES